MPRLHTSLTVLLGVVATGSLLYSWQLRDRLAEAETNRTAVSTEQARLQKHVALLAHDESFGQSAPPPVPRAATTPIGGAVAAPTNGRERFNQLEAMRDSPEVRTLIAMQQRAALDGRYASLFKKLNLAPADLERFKNLLVEKQAAAGDVISAARSQGLNPRDNRDQIRDLITAAETETDASIRSTLGDAVYRQYEQYEQTAPQRTVVGQLEQRLSYSSTPLASSQTEQLVGLLAAAAPARNPDAGPVFTPPGGGFGGGRSSPITDAVVAQSQSFLSSQQIQALRQLQQEQAAQAQLRLQMRNRMPTTTATSPAKPPGP